jgi:hypothetical protein
MAASCLSRLDGFSKLRVGSHRCHVLVAFGSWRCISSTQPIRPPGVTTQRQSTFPIGALAPIRMYTAFPFCHRANRQLPR